MKKIITLIILCTALTATVSAQTDDTQAKKIAVKARIGYSIGGTAPIGLPPSAKSKLTGSHRRCWSVPTWLSPSTSAGD